jgi:hypothetical protein
MRLRREFKNDEPNPLADIATSFFLLGFIRSGTTFWAHTLNELFRDWEVCHEPFISDYLAYLTFQAKGEEEKLEYISEVKARDLKKRLANLHIQGYGEANPYLRVYGRWLKEVFPQARLAYLVRDPRDVIRSVMSREIMGPKDPVKNLYNPPTSWSRKEWQGLPRFEKICVLWAEDNKRMRKEVGTFFQLERLTQDYDYFFGFIQHLTNSKIEIDEAVWREKVASPLNKTPDYKMDHWKHWSSEQKEIFERQCAEEMSRHGYDLDW